MHIVKKIQITLKCAKKIQKRLSQPDKISELDSDWLDIF